MNRKLQAVFEQAEKERHAIVTSLAAISSDKFYFRPKPGKWSVSQILFHIILSERISLVYMKKKSLGIEQAGDSGFWEELKFLVLKISQRLPLKFKAPDVIAQKEPESLPLDELAVKWNAVRAEQENFLQQLPDQHQRRLIYKHPFAGRLNVYQAVAFMREHVNHHLPQIKRLL
jgi:uncharacterized damage-inducible protein DinB